MRQNGQRQLRIIDTTLREGEQSPGVYFDTKLKKKIIGGLARVGVDEIEIGVACRENKGLESLSHYIRHNYPCQSFSIWSRCLEKDIHYGASLSPSCLSLSIPVSDLHLEKKLGKDRKWVLNCLRQSVDQALTAGVAKVAVGFEDASRAEPAFVLELARVAEEAGAFRLRLADTVGVCTPTTTSRLLEAVAGLKMELGVHCHNDFGMATANTMVALENGALWGDATLLGLGERAGNSRLEEVLGFLVLQKKNHSYDLTILTDLSRMLAREIGLEVPHSRPIVGANIFSCETGIHLHGIMEDPSTYEPFAPELVGASRKLLIGRMAGRRSVAATLTRLGLPLPEESRLTRLTRQIRSLASREERSLADHEIRQLAIGP